MQNKTKIRPYLTQISIVTLEKNQKVTTVLEEEETFRHLCAAVNFIKCSNHDGKHTADPQKIKTRNSTGPSRPNTRDASKITESRGLKRHVQTHVQSGTFPSDEMKATQMVTF